MSKKRLYLIIGITAIVTIGFFFAAYIISRDTGTPDTQPTNPFENFFPFGKGSSDEPTEGSRGTGGASVNTGTESGGTNNTSVVNQKTLLALRQVTTVATAGYTPSTQSGKTSVHFVEKATGNVFETLMENMRKDRISNALMPKIEEVFFGNSNKFIAYRYVKDGESKITTFIRNLSRPATGSATTTESVNGSFLPENILSVIVSPDTNSLFYFTKTTDFDTHVAMGSVFNFQKNTSTQVFQSPFSEWLPVYFDGKTVALQTKASQKVPGFLYTVSLPNGGLKKVIGDINGLTALPSHDLQKILYSQSNRGGVELFVYDRKEKKSTSIPLQTLPEKCVWASDNTVVYCAAPDYIPTAEYPDAWYQGSVQFNDAVWKIDTKTGKLAALFTPETFNAPKMDMERLTLSQNKDFLFFINKIDGTLWGYELPK